MKHLFSGIKQFFCVQNDFLAGRGNFPKPAQLKRPFSWPSLAQNLPQIPPLILLLMWEKVHVLQPFVTGYFYFSKSSRWVNCVLQLASCLNRLTRELYYLDRCPRIQRKTNKNETRSCHLKERQIHRTALNCAKKNKIKKNWVDFICLKHNGGQIKGLLAGHDCIKSQVGGSDCESPQQSLKFKTPASIDSMKLKNFNTPYKVTV